MTGPRWIKNIQLVCPVMYNKYPVVLPGFFRFTGIRLFPEFFQPDFYGFGMGFKTFNFRKTDYIFGLMFKGRS